MLVNSCTPTTRHRVASRRSSVRRWKTLQTLVDTALERTEAALSTAVSTSAWKPHSGEWLALKALNLQYLVADPLIT